MFKIIKKIIKDSKNTTNELEIKTKQILQEKYSHFQNLLATNNYVLNIMADLEEKFGGKYLFDMHYVKTNTKLISYEVKRIINYLNLLSNDKYLSLNNVYEKINSEIEKIISYKMEVPVSDLTLPLEEISKNSISIAGGKMSNLAEIKNNLKIPTPEGFVITSYAFVKFIDYNNLNEKISDILSLLNIEKLENIEECSKKIQMLIYNSQIPPELETSISKSYERLIKKIGYKCKVSIRSSAICEDTDFSFAGQYTTFLNTPEELILQRYKEVVASLFNTRAIFYYKTKGFSENEMVMSVGVLSMINAKSGGVMYTTDPNNPDSQHIIINAVKGLGKLVADGTIEPYMYVVSRYPELTIINKKISNQDRLLVCDENEGIKEVKLTNINNNNNNQCLSYEEVISLSKIGLSIEKHYGQHQDVEWAIDQDNNIYVLQTRPLKIFAKDEDSKVCLPTRIKGYKILLDKGIIACKGVGFGKAFILNDESELKNFPEGSVLVAKHTNPKYVIIMNKASAIITDVGSPTGHMASLSREYDVPTIVDTDISTRIIKNGQEITVDAINCVIYDGKVEELIEYSKKRKKPYKDSHVYKTLERVLKYIVPLNLVDPTDKDFNIDNCKTFHDITRFAHEYAMYEMFTMWEDYDNAPHSIPLSAGIPIDILVLDIGGGLKEGVSKATFDDVLSIPLLAILRGMKSMKWPEPPPVDAKGFFGMIAHTASIPENQLQETGKKSFCVTTYNYMNFSIRLGYHLSMIEAYAGDNINDNYIKFFFKGGGASLDRRLRRVRLISEILKKMGFRVTIKEDVIDAAITKYKTPSIEEKLEIIGKLTAYTKQLDMVMFNDAVTDMYIEQFIKDNIKD